MRRKKTTVAPLTRGVTILTASADRPAATIAQEITKPAFERSAIIVNVVIYAGILARSTMDCL